MDISKIDKNFEVKALTERGGLSFYDVNTPPFAVSGVFYENGMFRRLPEAVAKSVSEGVYALHANTAGGCVRFKTDSRRIAISAKLGWAGRMSHFPLSGTAGLDMFQRENGKWRYRRTFIPPYDVGESFESEAPPYPDKAVREIMIYFPLYTDVKELLVGLDSDAAVLPPEPLTIERPIVFYGSSITQGGCASRPGNAYTNQTARALDAACVNLGFSGNGCGEKEITDYTASLAMSAFVLDYDYNAPTPEHLKNTHERFYRAVRERHPDIPIVMLSRPRACPDEDEQERIRIITETYENALARGDRHVALITGPQFITEDIADTALVDGTHPNDVGFAAMTEAVVKALRAML